MNQTDQQYISDQMDAPTSTVASPSNQNAPVTDADMFDVIMGNKTQSPSAASPVTDDALLNQIMNAPANGNSGSQVNGQLLQPSQAIEPAGNSDDHSADPFGEQLARQAGLASRYLLKGAMSIPDNVGDLANTGINAATGEINKLTGTNIPQLGMPSQTTDAMLTKAGLPTPQGDTEKAVGDVSQLLSGITSGGEGFLNDIKATGTGLMNALKSGSDTTAGAIKGVANVLYKRADDLGGSYSPNFIGKVFDDMTGPKPTTPTELVAAQDDPVRNIVSKYENARGQPFTLSDGQILDEKLGDAIDANTDPITGPNSDAVALKQAQTKLRQALVNPDPEDVVGAPEGAQALADARQAWSQAMKANDIQRIMTRAKYSQNPATVLQTGARNLLVSGGEGNPRGLNDDETAALQNMAKTGAGTNVLRMLGSRLVPYIGTAIGENVGGLPGAAIGTAIGHAGAAAARSGASGIQMNKAQNVINTLGKNYPQLSQLPASPMASDAPSTMRFLMGLSDGGKK